MIEQLDGLLRRLLLAEAATLTDEAQVGFEAPDDQWRNRVTTLTTNGQPANAVNLYLVKVGENVALRSNEVIRTVTAGVVIESPAPKRLDCRYLITAWSPAPATPSVEPALDEHALLYEVAAALLRHSPLVPAEIYAPDPVPAGHPGFADAELPIHVLSEDGFAKQAEFWGTMGEGSRWKPALDLVVTLPVLGDDITAGVPVTTQVVDYRMGDQADGEVVIRVGGVVRDATNPLPDGRPAPVVAATVELRDVDVNALLGVTETNLDGEFTFSGLRRALYTISARAPGRGAISRQVEVPSLSGEYDLTYQ